jgi:two-component system CheB/CheR fusion protein
MCREGLLHSLRTALQEAKKSNAFARRDGLRVKTNGHSINAALEVTPLVAVGEGRHYLVMFQDLGAVDSEPATAAPKRRTKKNAAAQNQEIERLQKELVAGREYLQSIIQDLEAANEELQSANEEILSSNEELQSTNEELDTAKEELQSTNEELNTVNEELHGRNEELARINSDLINLLNGVQIAIVIVSRDLRIRRFTPVAEKILNLIPGDIGRPISQIKPNINCPDLEQLLTSAIDNISVQHRDVRDAQGRLHSLTVRPYKNIDNRIDGAVLALFDIDEVRRHEEKEQATRAFYELVFQTAPCPMLVLDRQLHIQEVNRAFCKRFKTTEAALETKPLLEVRAKWVSPQFKSALEASLASDHNGADGQSALVDGEDHSPYHLLVRRWDGDHDGGTRLLLVMDFDGAGDHQ